MREISSQERYSKQPSSIDWSNGVDLDYNEFEIASNLICCLMIKNWPYNKRKLLYFGKPTTTVSERVQQRQIGVYKYFPTVFLAE